MQNINHEIMPKKILLFILLLLEGNSVLCQTENQIIQKNPKRFEYYFNGGFGLYFPTEVSTLLAKYGPVYSFQAQINYKHNYFTRFAFDQYNIGYSDNALINGQAFRISDKVQTLIIGFDFGYTFHATKRFSPFIYSGLGYASMDVPTVNYEKTTSAIEISSTQKPFLSLRGGMGGEYEFNKYLIVFAELQYLTIPFKTDISNKQLNGVSLQIGFKTPLQ